MLPDFPSLKAEIQKILFAKLRRSVDMGDPVISQVKRFTQHEGKEMQYQQVGGSRRALAFLWFDVTRLSLAQYVPDSAGEWFRWNSFVGTLSSRLLPEPQSWEALVTHAESLSLTGVPSALSAHPAFALWFILVYPHRFCPMLAKFIEDSIFKANTA